MRGELSIPVLSTGASALVLRRSIPVMSRVRKGSLTQHPTCRLPNDNAQQEVAEKTGGDDDDEGSEEAKGGVRLLLLCAAHPISQTA